MLCGLGGAKNSATHTCTHWGYCSPVGEQESKRTHNMDGEKRESTEVLKEEEEAAMREQVGQRMRRT